MAIRWTYPLKVDFDFQQRALARDILIRNRKHLVNYKRFLANKHDIPVSRINESRSDF